MASAIFVALGIVFVTFVIWPLFTIMLMPNPKLIADYQDAISKIQDLIYGLSILGILALICAKI